MTLNGKWQLTLGLLALAIASSGSTAAVAQEQRPLVAGGDSPGLFLVYTGDVIGYIDPCG